MPSPDCPLRLAVPRAAWEDFVAHRPLFANLSPDVEALLVRRGSTGTLECFACGIDRCYALAGIVREQRRGLGRDDARSRVSALFSELRHAAEATHEF